MQRPAVGNGREVVEILGLCTLSPDFWDLDLGGRFKYNPQISPEGSLRTRHETRTFSRSEKE